MPTGSKNLTLRGQDRRTVATIIAIIVGIGASAFLLTNLSSRRTAVAQLRSEVEGKERWGASVQLPGEEDLEAWAQRESRVRSTLLSEDTVPEVYQEITRIMTQNRLERYTVDTVEKTVGDGDSPFEKSLRLLGVQRYLSITVKFRADYRDAASFVGDVAALPRSLAIESLEFKRNLPLVDGTVVINVYKRGTA